MADNVVHALDGSLHHFPADAKPEEMQQFLDEYEKKIHKADKFYYKIGTTPEKAEADNRKMLTGSAEPTGPGFLKSGAKDTGIELARPFTVGPAIKAGTMAAEAAPLPPIGKGIVGLLAGGGTYLGIDSLLQHLKSDPPKDIPESLISSGVNAASTEGLNFLMKGLTSRVNALRGPQTTSTINKLDPTFSQQLNPGVGQKVAQGIENTFAPGAKRAAQANSNTLMEQEMNKTAADMADRSIDTVTNPHKLANNVQYAAKSYLQRATNATGTSGETLKFLDDLSQGMAKGKKYEALTDKERETIDLMAERLGMKKPSSMPAPDLSDFKMNGLKQLIETDDSPMPVIDKIISDPKQLERTLNSGKVANVPSLNIRRDLKGYSTNQIMRNAKNLDGSLNADKLVQQWNNPEFLNSKNQLFSKTDQGNINDLFDAFKRTQQGAPTGGNLKFGLIRGTMTLSPVMLTHYLSGPAGMVLAGVELGGAALAKAMTNPKTARLLVSAAQGVPLGVSDQYASRVISSALKGTIVNAIDDKGNKIPVKIGEKQMEPMGQ